MEIETTKSRKRQRFLNEDQTNIVDEEKTEKSFSLNPEFEIPKNIPFIAKLNGVAFKVFTRDFAKPIDFLILNAMYLTLNDLTSKFNVTVGYTIEDKIFLIFNKPQGKKHIFRGNVQKICSCLASYCAVRFHYHLLKAIQEEWFSNLKNYSNEQLTKMNENVNDHFKYFECKLQVLPLNDSFFKNSYINLITKNFNNFQTTDKLPNNLENINENSLKNIVKYGLVSKSILSDGILLKNIENSGKFDSNMEIKKIPKSVKIINYIIENENQLFYLVIS